MDYEPLHLAFFVIVGLLVVGVALMVFKVALRNLPLWLFEMWPHLAGVALGGALAWSGRWQVGVLAAGVGLAMGWAWTAALNRSRRIGRENSSLERVHWKLIKWAQR
jgi:hypothetical protein